MTSTSTMYRLMIEHFSRTDDDAPPVVTEYGLFRDRRNASETGSDFCLYEDYLGYHVVEVTTATPEEWDHSVDSTWF